MPSSGPLRQPFCFPTETMLMNKPPSRSGSRDPFYNSKEWKALRAKRLARDGYCCTNCGAYVKAKGMNRVDHIVQRKVAPHLSLELSNVRTLCVPCDNARHSEKGARGEERVEIGLDGYPVAR